MLGDDSDSSVMTVRVGFGGVSDAREGSVRFAEEQGDGVQVGGWSQNGQRKQGVMWQLRADKGFMKTYGCDAHDAMR